MKAESMKTVAELFHQAGSALSCVRMENGSVGAGQYIPARKRMAGPLSGLSGFCRTAPWKEAADPGIWRRDRKPNDKSAVYAAGLLRTGRFLYYL